MKRLLLACCALLACNKSSPPSHTPHPGGQPPRLDVPPPAPPRKLRTIEGISEYQLDNGLVVLLFPDPSKDKVTVNITYLVGSRHEGAGEAGMAHLLEHMLFKGSNNFGDVWQAMQELGADNNGTTDTDRTNYYETLPASEQNLEFALRMEADKMTGALLLPAHLASEFSVVRNELEIGENNVAEVLYERVMASAFTWHNYGRSVIGSRSDIEKVPIDALRRFYEKYYQPDNAVLVVAGKFDEDKTLAVIADSFGRIPRPTRVLTPGYTVEPPQDGEREVSLRRSGDVAVLAVAYHTVAGSHVDQAAIDALDHVLTGEPSGRLYQALVKTGMASSVSSYAPAWRDPGVYVVFVEMDAKKPVAPVKTKLLEIVEGLARKPPDEREVRRFKNRSRKDFRRLLSNSERAALALSESAAAGDWRLLFLARDREAAVTGEQLARVATTYFKPANRTFGVFTPTAAPDRAPLETRPDVAAMVDGYRGQAAAAEGEAFAYTVENIEKRTRRGALASGLKWAFLPKETRADAVVARLVLRYGSEKDFTGRVAAAELLPEMLARGTRSRSFQDLRDAFDELDAEVRLSGEPGRLIVELSSTREKLPALIALVDEMLRQPSFPPAELAVLVDEKVAALEVGRQDPEVQAYVAYDRATDPAAPTDLRYTPTTDEEIARLRKLKVADLRALHALLGASAGEFVVIGDFDDVALEKQLGETWAGWKAPRPFSRIARPVREVPGSTAWVDTPDKESGVIVFGRKLAFGDGHRDYPTLLLANYALGGASFAGRLMKRLRDKDGYSYYFYARAGALLDEEHAYLQAYGAAAASNCDKALVAAIEEVERLRREDIPVAELEALKQSWVRDFGLALQNDGRLARYLADTLYLGRTLVWYSQLNATILALSPAAVRAFFTTYADPAVLVRVTAGDKQKAAAQQ